MQAKLKNHAIEQPESPEMASTSGQNEISFPKQLQLAPKPQLNNYDLPPEFAPENDQLNKAAPAMGNRSASCADVDVQPTPQLMKQRDPSTSSLLRKRMSEERQGFSSLNKRMSQSSASGDRFIVQKDPSQSSILRRKMSNRSSGSFDRAGSEMASTERFQFHQSRIPNERTFYRDSHEYLKQSATELPDQRRESAGVETASAKMEMASPLSLQSQDNRRFMLSSTENLPQSELYTKSSIETEPDSGIDSNFVEDPPRKTDTEKQLSLQQNVSDEEKVQILLSKSQKNAFETNSDAIAVKVENVDAEPKPRKPTLQLMSMNDVKTVEVEVPTQSKLQYQYVAKLDSTLQPQEAQTNDYSFSKLFDNYKSEQCLFRPSNASTPDLGGNKQREPSFKQIDHAPPLMVEQKSTHDKLLPPAGNFPERRASEICNPQMIPQASQPQFIKQKDLRTSNVLNRRRRNLSQTSLSDAAAHDPSNVKVTKTISFEQELAQNESEQMSPYAGASVRIGKGVSFEFGQQATEQNERNTFDFSNPTAVKRPHR